MAKPLLELLLAPALVGAATLVGSRWGPRMAGLVSGLPLVVGPVLLIAAQAHGAAFAAHAANGTLLGLVALNGFALAYARSARRPWMVSLGLGWASASFLAALVWLLPLELPFPFGLGVATASLLAAWRLMPAVVSEPIDTPLAARQRNETWLRMAATAALVLVLSEALAASGPRIGGILTALPVVVSVLAVSAHRNGGASAVVALLRGALIGMTGFVAFCAVVAACLSEAGIWPAFAAATAAAVGLQAVTEHYWLSDRASAA